MSYNIACSCSIYFLLLSDRDEQLLGQCAHYFWGFLAGSASLIGTVVPVVLKSWRLAGFRSLFSGRAVKE